MHFGIIMFDFVIKAALRQRFLTIALAAFCVVYGAIITRQLSVDVFPDLNRPTVHVVTELEGMAPEEIEAAVSRPIENAVNGVPGVTRIYSSSATGISVVRVEFQWNTDLKAARLNLAERLGSVKARLPKDAQPFLTPTSSIMGEIQMVGLSSDDPSIDPMKLRSIADWQLRPRLLSIPGVAQATVIGGEQEQIQILINPIELQRRMMGPRDLAERLESLSIATGGGFIRDGEKEWLIRNIGRITAFEDIGDTPIGTHLGRPVLLKDVATIQRGPAARRGDASINGKDGVIIMIQKQSIADTLALTRLIDKSLKEFGESLPAGVKLESNLFKQADFIESAIGNVVEALRDGTIIVSIVLLLFLLNLRTTLITLTAIPLSLLMTAIIFHFLGLGINTMTLGGLAVAIGELVDDAIVDVENVFRRLRENSQKQVPEPTLRVIYRASSEIRNSIVLATIIVILVFVPLFALPGLEGRLFTPIGIAYVISILASLLVSITVTPVLCYFLLGKLRSDVDHDSWLVKTLKTMDRAILDKTLDRPFIIIGFSAVLFLGSTALLPFIGRDFLPPFNEGSAMVEASVKAGISLEASSELAKAVEKAILSVPEVKSTGRRTGRAEEDDHAAGVNHSEWEVALKKSKRSREEVFSDIRSKVKAALPPDGYFSISQPISHRLDHILSGVKAQVAIKLFGPDLRILRQQGAEIRNAISGVEGVVDLQMEGQSLFPQYKIFPMRSDLAKYGMVPGDAIESLELMLQGVSVTRIFEEDKILDVQVRLEEKYRKTIDDIKKLSLHVLPTGRAITVAEVADVFETSGPNAIERENQKRRIAISFNTSGRDIESTVSEVKERIQKAIQLPSGYFIEFDGQYESQRQAIRMVLLLGGLSILGIFLVLAINFRSPFIAFQIMVNIPLALIGAVVAVYLSDRTFSVASLIAFITLCGIASRNGILMINHYLFLMAEEGEAFSKEMIIRGSLERLVPVLMTASTAMLALTPLLFARGEAGKEILHPVAVVIVSGLLSSTILDIFVTPAIFYRFGRKAAERAVKNMRDASGGSPAI
jgi:Cu(I)/Ag(I) efflux system membrane protein CusA/SilA